MQIIHKIAAPLLLATLLTGCATTYSPPGPPENFQYSSNEKVREYLQRYIDTYGDMASSAGKNGDKIAGLSILAALGGTTALALGAGTDVGILAGSAGAGLNATKAYLSAPEQIAVAAAAQQATLCIQDAFVSQVNGAETLRSAIASAVFTAKNADSDQADATANAAFIFEVEQPSKADKAEAARTADAFVTYLARNNATFSEGVHRPGQLAIEAARTVSSRAQVKFAGLRTIPDFDEMRKAFEEAQRREEAAETQIENEMGDDDDGNETRAMIVALAQELVGYEKELLACKAKLPE